MNPPTAEDPPRLRIVRGGEPTDEELAALVAAVALRGAAPVAEPKPLRQPLHPWVASGLVKGTRTKV
ncbi:MAG TPA: acyl-CoA carboxylase epsilon subunit [Mycobacteriales bacterium]|nr:acyl-CoA carboxylase epsilon subunit [Mycobacteriales bacterium]